MSVAPLSARQTDRLSMSSKDGIGMSPRLFQHCTGGTSVLTKKVVLYFLLLLFCLPDLSEAQNPNGRVLRNLAYVMNGSERQRLDLYLPDDNQTEHPLVIWIHGGAWEEGTKDWCPAKALLSRGYAAASIGYRLSKQATFPAQIEDCKTAVRWLRAHASEYGIDSKRIGAWGASAGGHLAALLGTTGKVREFDVGENLSQASDVQCVVDWFGPATFLRWGEANSTSLDSSPVARLLGGLVSTHQELARRASPVSFVSHESAPFRIMHGDRDQVVPLQQSKELEQALKTAGVDSTLRIISGAGHGGSAFSDRENLKMIADFFDLHLMPVAAPAK